MKRKIINSKIYILEDFLNWACDYFIEAGCFFGHGTDNAWDEAVMIAMHVLKLPANVDKTAAKKILTSHEREQLIHLATLRATKHIPFAYLTGVAWYAGEQYIVNNNVIIPRSPLFELIQHKFKPWLDNPNPKYILDMCTGSGVLAIVCSKEFPDSSIDAIDISKEALAVAELNTKLHSCQCQVKLIQSDLFNEIANNNKKYDIIISNPPYVSFKEMKQLPHEYYHEPRLALASKNNGLHCAENILKQASDYLTTDGILVIELGNSWRALEEKYNKVAFTWLEFAHGGEGVCLFTAQYLSECKKDFQ